VVVTTDNRHEERGYGVIVGDLVENLIITNHKLTFTTLNRAIDW